MIKQVQGKGVVLLAKRCCHYKGTAGRRATLCVNPNEMCPLTFGDLRLVSQNTVKDGCADCFRAGSTIADAVDAELSSAGVSCCSGESDEESGDE